MLRRSLAILLIFSFIAAHFQCFFVVAGFELNRNYIAQKLCENRDKPWMHCNGQCVLAKKMKQVEQNEKKEEQNQQRQRLQEVISLTAEPVYFAGELLQVFIPTVKHLTPEPSVPSPFQPPKFSV